MANSNILFWNRLEGSPQSQDFERSLQAEIRDPLWLLARQWQLGEFKAEDAGSAIMAGVHTEQIPLTHFQPHDQDKRPISDQAPMEALIEAVRTSFDLSLRMEMGLHWLRMLRRALPEQPEIEQAFREVQLLQFKLPLRESPADQYEHAAILSDPEYLQGLQAAVRGNMIDGGVLYMLLTQTGVTASDFLPEKDEQVDALGVQFLQWFGRVYGQEGSELGSWHSSHLEYRFAMAPAPGDPSRTLLTDEYYGDGLNWYHFDYATEQSLSSVELQTQTQEQHVFPSEISYPGMPAARWWEMEDALIDFANIRASTSETAKLLYSEFGMLYSNDWLVMPLDLSVGNLNKITHMVITDVFGQQVLVERAVQAEADENWGLFQVHDRQGLSPAQADPYLFLPAVAHDILEGQVLERVEYIRDEMANMVWAVETIVPDGLGGWTNGLDSARRQEALIYKLAVEPDIDELSQNEAEVFYQLANTVPPNWIPFIPVKPLVDMTDGRKLVLQRAAMPRLVPGFPARRIRPKTTLLGENLGSGAFYVFEEEVPRSGATLQLQWRRTRWFDGRTYVWLGRRKRVGRGEGSSNLKFDHLVDRN